MSKRISVSAMLVLACSMSAMAQTNPSSEPSMKKDDVSGNRMSMTGCIAEKDGKYMMMNKEHLDGVQLMGSQDMKSHVGHMVKVTGMVDRMDGTSGDSMKSGEDMSNDKMKMSMMRVSSMKMISTHCDTWSANK